MATPLECPRCGNVGFIRTVRVIKAGNCSTEWCCGACDHTWRAADEPSGLADSSSKR